MALQINNQHTPLTRPPAVLPSSVAFKTQTSVAPCNAVLRIKIHSQIFLNDGNFTLTDY